MDLLHAGEMLSAQNGRTRVSNVLTNSLPRLGDAIPRLGDAIPIYLSLLLGNRVEPQRDELHF